MSSNLGQATNEFSAFSDIKAEYAGNEDLSANDAPHLLRVIQSFKPTVFDSNVYNQKFGKHEEPPRSSASLSRFISHFYSLASSSFYYHFTPFEPLQLSCVCFSFFYLFF